MWEAKKKKEEVKLQFRVLRSLQLSNVLFGRLFLCSVKRSIIVMYNVNLATRNLALTDFNQNRLNSFLKDKKKVKNQT